MTFSKALDHIRSGTKVARDAWINNASAPKYVEMEVPGGTKNPYLVVKTADNTFEPYSLPSSDLFANDWETV